MKFRLLVAMIVALTLTAMGCSSDSDDAADDPAAVLADYLEVWNAEDAEAVMVFYAEDAVVENHPARAEIEGIPNVDGKTMTGRAQILLIEEGMQGFQASTGTMEYLNMEVSGNTVTFDTRFINGSGSCFSSGGSETTVENGLITRVVWADTDGGMCP
jgi:ketosteroid isomerase-like protein